jgi:hypothetical protein
MTARALLERMLALILQKHLMAAAKEAAAALDDEIEARVADRVADLRAQLHQQEED